MLVDTSYSIGPLMKAARKFKKFNQADVARAIGCSQSALSKMEHNLLVPSAPQWFLFSRFTMIPPESLETGVIDRHTKIKFDSDEVSLGFKFARKFQLNRSIKVKELYPFIVFLQKEKGDAGLKTLFNELQMDPEFFLDFDNLISFTFFRDFLLLIIKEGHLSEEAIKKIVKDGQNDVYWGSFKEICKRISSLGELLNAYAYAQIYHQVDFKLIVVPIDGHYTLTYQAQNHLQDVEIPDDIVDVIRSYQKFTLENLAETFLKKKVQATLNVRSSDKMNSHFDVR